MVTKLLTINIRKYLVQQPMTKRTPRAVRYIRDRVAHYTKTDIENVKLSTELNSMIFKYYSKKMVPVKLNVNIDNGIATATPFGMQKKTEIRKASEKKAEKTAAPTKEKPVEQKKDAKEKKVQAAQPAAAQKQAQK